MSRNVNSWRHFLEFHVIDNWGTCVRKLKEWDSAGPNYSNLIHNHYQGNMWWSKASFIMKKTSPLKHSEEEWGYINDIKITLQPRHRAESWIMCEGGRHYSVGNYIADPYKRDGYYYLKGLQRTNQYANEKPSDQYNTSRLDME